MVLSGQVSDCCDVLSTLLQGYVLCPVLIAYINDIGVSGIKILKFPDHTEVYGTANSAKATVLY